METFIKIIVILAIAFGCVCFEAWLGMLIINWVAGLFGSTWTITFWQSFGVCVLCSFIGRYFRGWSSKKD